MSLKHRFAFPIHALALGLTLMAAPPVHAAYPDGQQVNIVVPFVPGGPVDIMARLLGERLSASLKTTVVVENRPGAGGNVGSSHVARATPDGRTLLLASGSILTMNEAIYASLNYSPSKDLVPVSVVGDMPLILGVHTSVAANTLPEFVDYARNNADKVFFSSPGNGTTPHAGAALFNMETGAKTTHVPYKGGAESASAVLSGTVTGAIDTPPALLPHIQSGRVKALAIAGPQRLSQIPDVPTTTEAGLPGLQVVAWFALAAPAGTPQATLDILNQEVRKALQDPALRERFAALAIRPVGDDLKSAADFTVAERARWAKVIREANIRIE